MAWRHGGEPCSVLVADDDQLGFGIQPLRHGQGFVPVFGLDGVKGSGEFACHANDGERYGFPAGRG